MHWLTSVSLVENIVKISTFLCARSGDNYVLELDLEPFNATFPRPTRSSSIGNGVQFLNRHLSSVMFRNKESLEPLLNFLRVHKHDGFVSLLGLGLLLNKYIISHCCYAGHDAMQPMIIFF